MMLDTTQPVLEVPNLSLDNFDNNFVHMLLKCLGKNQMLHDKHSEELKLTKKITGTSLMFEDEYGHFYKHINIFNEREPLFYYTILLSSSGINLIEQFENDIQHSTKAVPFIPIYQSKNKIQINNRVKNHTSRNSYGLLLENLPKVNEDQGDSKSCCQSAQLKKSSHKFLTHPDRQPKTLKQMLDAHHLFYKQLLCKIECQLKRFYGLESILQFSQCMHNLKSLNLIPDFLGIKHAAMILNKDDQQKCQTKWSKTPEYQNLSCISTLQLNNIFVNYERPAILDIKLGSGYIGEHSGQPGYKERMLFSHYDTLKRDKITDNWRSLKKHFRETYNFIEASFKIQNISPSSIGFENDSCFKNTKHLLSLLKSWRQEKVVRETTQSSMGFRVCGCFFIDKNGKKVNIDTKQGARFSNDEAINAVQSFLESSKLDEIDKQHLINQVESLTSWILSQPYYHFYATSLVLYYDINTPHKISLKWLDFAHAIPQFSKLGHGYFTSGSRHQVNSHMTWGLDNFIQIIRSLS